ncbi:MAG TPA: glycoside hydrolase family 15 protein [Gaiellaceae bacterium]|nr:glycoside hydrolase family 15 protein [Gaiellaceae bacterium]
MPSGRPRRGRVAARTRGSGATPSCARSSSSRPSPTRRPAASSPPRRRRSPSSSEASGTGNRYCWVRDATFALYALMTAGYTGEARAWRDWLVRAVAGDPTQMQIMYGVAGERRLTELELGWLPGYEGSAPVRIGNDASTQYQLDVYGELMDALHQARRAGIASHPTAWHVQRVLLDFLESGWREPDDGIWEVRGPRRHFTHSKVMAWLALDRAVKAVERFALAGPVDRWRALRDEIHAEVCREGYDAERQTFTQYYGSSELDASLLMIPLVGFLAPSDLRVAGTVEAVQRELVQDGLRPPLLDEDRRRRTPGGRGRLSRLHAVACRQPRPSRSAPGGTPAVRADPRPAQRSRASLRGVRPGV